MIQTVTVDKVPRDLAAILALTLSQRYKVANTLGVLSEESAKAAFGSLAPEAQAQFVLDALLEFDRKGSITSPMNNLAMPGQMQLNLQNSAQVPTPPGGIPGAPGGMVGMGQPTMPTMGNPSMGMSMPGAVPGGMPMSMPGGLGMMPGGIGGMPGTQVPTPAAPTMQSASTAPVPNVNAEAITKLAESMQSMAAAQAEMAAQLKELATRQALTERLAVVTLTALTTYAATTQKAEIPAMAQYFGQLLSGNVDQTILACVGLGKA